MIDATSDAPAVMARAIAVEFPDGNVVAFDIRAEESVPGIVEAIRAKLDARMAVGVWDSADVMPPFSVARTPGAYVVCNEGGPCGAFATVEAALKHGLTAWDGFRPGWWREGRDG